MGSSADRAAKRAADIVGAALALLFSLPVTLTVTLAVLLAMGRPVLFRQSRVGRHGAPFLLLKFRTMLAPDPDRGLVTEQQRQTRLGSFLRSTSLDELPNLWNVLRGDMSLVGPRPLVPADLDPSFPGYHVRHEVRPGITGLAQVSGRNALTGREKFELDSAYVQRISPLNDLRLLVRTVPVVLARKNVWGRHVLDEPESRESFKELVAEGLELDGVSAAMAGGESGSVPLIE